MSLQLLFYTIYKKRTTLKVLSAKLCLKLNDHVEFGFLTWVLEWLSQQLNPNDSLITALIVQAVFSAVSVHNPIFLKIFLQK